jgi:hypothetical protein
MVSIINLLLIFICLSLLCLILLIYYNDLNFGLIGIMYILPVIILSIINNSNESNKIIGCNESKCILKVENNLETLFKNSIKYGYCIRTNKLNGLESWNNAKKELEKLDLSNTTFSWNFNQDEIEKLYQYAHNQLNMKGDDNDSKIDYDTWEKYHFFLQLVRIPKLNYENPNFKIRVCQIGYNIGQMQATKETNPNFYSKEALQWIEDNKLLEYNTYIK